MNKWCFNQKVFFKLVYFIKILISKNSIVENYVMKVLVSLVYRVSFGNM